MREDGALGAEAARQPARRPSRYVPVEDRRTAWERDGYSCGFLGPDGKRCGSTYKLQIHHEHAFARGGESKETNLAVRCASHNLALARKDFGAEWIQERIEERRVGAKQKAAAGKTPPPSRAAGAPAQSCGPELPAPPCPPEGNRLPSAPDAAAQSCPPEGNAQPCTSDAVAQSADVLTGLRNLGFKRAEAVWALGEARSRAGDGAPLEVLLRAALARLWEAKTLRR